MTTHYTHLRRHAHVHQADFVLPGPVLLSQVVERVDEFRLLRVHLFKVAEHRRLLAGQAAQIPANHAARALQRHHLIARPLAGLPDVPDAVLNAGQGALEHRVGLREPRASLAAAEGVGQIGETLLDHVQLVIVPRVGEVVLLLVVAVFHGVDLQLGRLLVRLLHDDVSASH